MTISQSNAVCHWLQQMAPHQAPLCTVALSCHHTHLSSQVKRQIEDKRSLPPPLHALSRKTVLAPLTSRRPSFPKRAQKWVSSHFAPGHELWHCHHGRCPEFTVVTCILFLATSSVLSPWEVPRVHCPDLLLLTNRTKNKVDVSSNSEPSMLALSCCAFPVTLGLHIAVSHLLDFLHILHHS